MAEVRTITIGSSELCTLRVPGDPFVSPRHAQISQTALGFIVEDLGSTNGTYVVRHGRAIKITHRVVMLQGDQIRVGRTLLPWVAD